MERKKKQEEENGGVGKGVVLKNKWVMPDVCKVANVGLHRTYKLDHFRTKKCRDAVQISPRQTTPLGVGNGQGGYENHTKRM